MTKPETFEIFLVAAPGTEHSLLAEAKALGFMSPKLVAGGVTVQGGWPDVWRANLRLRETPRILARLGEFHVSHLAQLDKLSHKFPWGKYFLKNISLRVEVTCKKSKIYHAGAAAQRIETAIKQELGASISPEASLIVKARIENNLCTISVDTSGESLHKRGHKEAVGKAPLRETLASYFLRQCNYDGKEPVVDPMCGSGTFVIEAAEIAMGLLPGRERHFAFEDLRSFDHEQWQKLRSKTVLQQTDLKFYGSDRDQGAIAMCKANAERAGVSSATAFKHFSVSDLKPPEGPAGLVIVNPPYGTRIGDKKPLLDLYAALGKTLLTRFSGWRVGLITTDSTLAKATGLPFAEPQPPVNHGGLKVMLFKTQALK
jgi:putative N6-adenine-specific DNA methylase